MSDFKEFQAKTLDQAIQDACQHFEAERTRLEIEILEDAKSGIFGLVGARKARVNARLAQLPVTSFTSVKKDEPKKRGVTASTARGAAPKTAAASSADSTTARAPAKTPRAQSAPVRAAAPRPNTDRRTETEENTPSSTHRAAPQGTRSYSQNPRDNDKRDVAKSDRPNDRKNYHNRDEHDEEDESQRKFLSKIIAHEDEELDDNVLDALDRQAMAKANLLGNMTEAEVRASGQGTAERRTFRAKPVRAVREPAPRARNDREHGQSPERVESKRVAPARGLKESRREEDLERKQFYEKKRQQQREANPPREIVVAEYDATPLPRVPLEELDTEKLITLTRETILKLVGHIVGFDAPVEVKIADDRVHVSIESEDTGLLIGREGQHLAAVQYIASRILTRTMESQIRIQVDTGDYHSRQDSRMELLALALAEKAKTVGRPQSTRPLSAYQRRVIHLALQEDTEIQTRSCGDGTLKRVIIMRRRGGAAVGFNPHDDADMEAAEENMDQFEQEHENTSTELAGGEFSSDDDSKN